jgi:uncharacterized protein YbjT (DUF2867 family)
LPLLERGREVGVSARILVAGGTGYLGRHLLAELLRRGVAVRALTRDAERLPAGVEPLVVADVTRPGALAGAAEGCDVVFSSLGITRQADGRTYEQIDYRANIDLLEEAVRAGVRRMVFVSVLHADAMRQTDLVRARERVVERLRAAPLSSCVVRPTGFFSDMTEIFEMARSGRAWVFGDGQHRINPIHGADLAVVCADAIQGDAEAVEAGGPEVFTQQAVAQLAFQVLGKPAHVSHLPDGVVDVGLALLRPFSKRWWNVAAFVSGAGRTDMVAPCHGTHTLRAHFESLAGLDAIAWPKLQPEGAQAVLLACSAVLSADGTRPLDDAARGALRALAHAVLQTDEPPPEAVALGDDLGAHVPEGPVRDQIVTMLVLCVLVDATIDPARLAVAVRAAAQLGRAPEIAPDLARLAQHEVLRARVCILRRIMRDLYGRTLWGGMGEIVAAGLSTGDPAIVARYRALGALPAGTFGRTLYAFYEDNQIKLPGEPFNPYVASLTCAHDARHVLAGWNPSFDGEICLAAFESGLSRSGQLDNLLAILIQGYAGIEILEPTPTMPTRPLDVGAILTEMARGKQADPAILSPDWDFWQEAALPLDEVRRRHGIAPGGRVPPGGSWEAAPRKPLRIDRVTILPESDGQRLGLSVHGGLATADVQAVSDLIARRAWSGRRIDLLLEIEDGAGYEGAGAMWADLNLAFANRDAFRRIAVVGSGLVQRALVAADRPIAAWYGADERFFGRDRRGEALAFLSG